MRSALAVLSLAVSLSTFLAATTASAQQPAASPTPKLFEPTMKVDDPLAPDNMVSGHILPLIVINTVGAEYERVIHPALGGIAARGHLVYVFLGAFDLLGTGVGGHYVYYIPFNVQMDAKMPSGPPAGPFIAAGVDVTRWSGRFRSGGYSANVRGWTFEPNVYAGYRIIFEHVFVAPRAGFGYAAGGAYYRDSAGNKRYYGYGHDFELHFDLVIGVCW